jgi:AcrR family transcriptional regulator
MSGARQRPGGRSALVRQRVLEAAAHILVEDGLEAATIPAIAARSGVHHTSIYRRWGERGVLLRDAILDAVDVAVPVADTGRLRDDLIVMLDGIRALLDSPLGVALRELVRSHDETLVELRRTYWVARLDNCSLVIERAVLRGELPPDSDHRLIFELLVGPIHARTLLSIDRTDDVATEVIVDAVLLGITRERDARTADCGVRLVPAP